MCLCGYSRVPLMGVPPLVGPPSVPRRSPIIHDSMMGVHGTCVSPILALKPGTRMTR